MEVDCKFVFGRAAGSIIHIHDESIGGSFEGDDIAALKNFKVNRSKRECLRQKLRFSDSGYIVFVLWFPFNAVDGDGTWRPSPVDMVPKGAIAGDDDFIGAVDEAFEVEESISTVGKF